MSPLLRERDVVTMQKPTNQTFFFQCKTNYNFIFFFSVFATVCLFCFVLSVNVHVEKPRSTEQYQKQIRPDEMCLPPGLIKILVFISLLLSFKVKVTGERSVKNLCLSYLLNSSIVSDQVYPSPHPSPPSLSLLKQIFRIFFL